MNMFNKVQLKKPARSKFDLSHRRVMTGYMGNLYLTFCQEITPGDTMSNVARIMMRTQPMLAPIYDHVAVKTDYFFVPIRIIWNESEDYFTGGEDGEQAPVLPYLTLTNSNKASTFPGELLDDFGVPDMSGMAFGSDTVRISALPMRAMLECYNEYYRNQNVEAAVAYSKGSGAVSGADFTALTTRRRSMWEKDRFTSALTDTQRGAQVLIPMSAIGSGSDIVYKTVSQVKKADGSNTPGGPGVTLEVGAAPNMVYNDGVNPLTTVRVENLDSVTVDNVTFTINDLRRAERLQEFLERLNVSGGRYTEYLMAIFATKSDDARLQRPEYLAGGRQWVIVSEVLSTATDGANPDVPPQGNMAGHGVSVGTSNRFKRRFTEHGYVIGITRVLPRTTYGQGIPKMLQRFDRFDWPTPQFANIGEQAIMTREIYATPANAKPTDNTIFGYTPRYSDSKYTASSVHGEFKTNLNFWTMAREFGSAPTLNKDFVEADPTLRIFAVQDSPPLLFDIFNQCSVVRALPYFGTPSI